ncbi:MAG: MOFRL family protein [Pirellulaceae bacterium]
MKQLSRIKGGGLARACRAGTLITLIISDVLGDPLDVIASGPTVADTSTPEDAIDVLRQFPIADTTLDNAVRNYLTQRASAGQHETSRVPGTVTNVIIGNNALAVDAAGMEAERRGYAHAMVSTQTLEGDAETVGEHLAHMAREMRQSPGPNCLITGGEPTVALVDPTLRGMGGRNQQLVLAALRALHASQPPTSETSPLDGIALLSGGTDGEDGPTDAAGAIIDRRIAEAGRKQGLDTGEYLRRNDAYHFFEQVNGLIKTGPTHTNVCDVRVVVVDQAKNKNGPL